MDRDALLNGDENDTVYELKVGPDQPFNEWLEREGVSPEEFQQTTEYWVSQGSAENRSLSQIFFAKDLISISHINCKPTEQDLPYDPQTIQQSYIKARERARHILLKRQFFKTRLSRPQLPILTRVFSALDQLYWMGDPDIQETLHLMATAMVTGCPVDKLVQLQIVGGTQTIGQQNAIAYDSARQCWIRKINLADKKSKQSRLEVPDFLGLGRLFQPGQLIHFKKGLDHYRHIYKGEIEQKLVSLGIPGKWVEFKMVPTLLLQHLIGKEEANTLRIETLFGYQTTFDMGGTYTAFDTTELIKGFSEELAVLYRAIRRDGYRSRKGGLFQWSLDQSLIQTAPYVGSSWSTDLSRLRKLVMVIQWAFRPS